MLKCYFLRIDSYLVYVAYRMNVEEIVINVPVWPGWKGGLSGCLHLSFNCFKLLSVPVQ